MGKELSNGLRIGSIFGGFFGLTMGFLMGRISFQENNAIIYPYEQEKMIIRTFDYTREGQIFISNDKRNYITMQKYLDTIQDKREQVIERAKIEKIVEW